MDRPEDPGGLFKRRIRSYHRRAITTILAAATVGAQPPQPAADGLDPLRAERDALAEALRRSEGLRMLAEAELALPRDAAAALALARRGAEKQPGPRAQRVLQMCLDGQHLLAEARRSDGALRSVAWARTGAAILCGDDGTAFVWSPADGVAAAAVLDAALTTGRRARHACSAGASDELILIAGTDRWMGTQLWSAGDDAPRATLVGAQHATVSPDGARIAAVTAGGDITIFAAADGAELHVAAIGRPLSALAWLPDGGLWAGTEDGRLIRCSAEGAVLAEWRGHERAVRCIAFSAGGQVAITGGDAGRAVVWNVPERRHTAVLAPHGQPVLRAALAAEGTRALTLAGPPGVDRLRRARVWDTAAAVSIEDDGALCLGAAITADGTQLATWGEAGTLRLTELDTGERTVLPGHRGRVLDAAFERNGQRLLSVDEHGTARLWSVRSGLERRRWQAHDQRIVDLAYAGDGSRLATASSDHTAVVWPARAPRDPVVLNGHTASLTAIAFAPAGDRLLTGGMDESASVWDPATGDELALLNEHDEMVTRVAFAADGDTAATASTDGTIRLWHGRGRPGAVLEHADAVLALAFAKGGGRLASATEGGAIHLWDVEATTSIALLASADHAAVAVAFAADDAMVWSLHEDHRVRALPTATAAASAQGQRPARPRGQPLERLRALPDGGVLSADGRALFRWRANLSEPTAEFVLDGDPSPLAFDVSADGTRLAAAYDDGSVAVWDLTDNTLHAHHGPYAARVTALAFGPSRRFATGTERGEVWLWDTDL